MKIFKQHTLARVAPSIVDSGIFGIVPSSTASSPIVIVTLSGSDRYASRLVIVNSCPSLDTRITGLARSSFEASYSSVL